MKSVFRGLLVVLISPGCRSAGAPARPAAAPAAPAAAAGQNDPDSIRWIRDSAEYRAALVQLFRQATTRVDTEARSHAAGTWAVVLDADETVISNVDYQLERARQGLPYTSESWNVWVKRRQARPLPGAVSFLQHVHTLGGRIAIVTNRLESECADTAAVFNAHSLPYDAMLCRPDGGSGDKNPRFEAVANGQTPAGTTRLDIVAFVGDNILDFPRLDQRLAGRSDEAFAEFGVRFFLVPNPMYGSWQ